MKILERIRFKSIGHRMMVGFMVLIVMSGLGISLSSIAVFKNSSYKRFESYTEDVIRQTTNNLEYNISKLEDISFGILSNSTIQQQLNVVNREILSEYGLQMIKQAVVKELEPEALYNTNIVSLSVISDSGVEFTVQKVAEKKIIEAYPKKLIYEANGSSVWGIDGDAHNVCVQRAILGFKTMKPIGYINIVCERDYFNNIIEDISKSYTSGAYVIDEEGTIVISNNPAYVGQRFPLSIDKIESSRKSYYNAIDNINAYYYKGDKMVNGWRMITTIPTNEFDKEINHFSFITIVICLVALLFAFLGNLILTKKLTKPTEELLKSMKKFGTGDFSQRIKIKSEDEIGQIAKQYNHMVENIEELIKRILSMEISQKQAEIEFLKMQINPHFLYNTLDTISWMGTMAGNEDVSDMAVALANLLRATVKNDGFVTVREEMKSVKDYLFIQRYRFGEKITVKYQIDESIQDDSMPSFLLQPLIENAIIHGLEPKLTPGTLILTISTRENNLEFFIEDDGVGMSPEEIKALYLKFESGEEQDTIGLKNVYRRLKLIYGDFCQFKIQSGQDQGIKIYFCIPKRLDKKKEDSIESDISF